MGIAPLYHQVSAVTRQNNNLIFFNINEASFDQSAKKKKSRENLSFESFNVMIKSAFLFVLTGINVFCSRNLWTQVYRTFLQDNKKKKAMS